MPVGDLPRSIMGAGPISTIDGAGLRVRGMAAGNRIMRLRWWLGLEGRIGVYRSASAAAGRRLGGCRSDMAKSIPLPTPAASATSAT